MKTITKKKNKIFLFLNKYGFTRFTDFFQRKIFLKTSFHVTIDKYYAPAGKASHNTVVCFQPLAWKNTTLSTQVGAKTNIIVCNKQIPRASVFSSQETN